MGVLKALLYKGYILNLSLSELYIFLILSSIIIILLFIIYYLKFFVFKCVEEKENRDI